MTATSGPQRRPTRPAIPVMLWRGALRRCPWCGDHRAYFVGWFAKQDACRACGTPWRRSDVGFELGALTITTIVTCGLVIIGAAVGLVLTAPDFAVIPIMIGLMILAIVVPVVIYPSSYSVWQAVDLAMRPPRPGEVPAPPVLRRKRSGA